MFFIKNGLLGFLCYSLLVLILLTRLVTALVYLLQRDHFSALPLMKAISAWIDLCNLLICLSPKVAYGL
ncbi:secreted protein [methanotrophic bacterial endosymbiont of Bathymodiolus sp.]|nr:secreted protein [methanotrophic bacterial endosymbiont of Bathymodiolus sp.]